VTVTGIIIIDDRCIQIQAGKQLDPVAAVEIHLYVSFGDIVVDIGAPYPHIKTQRVLVVDTAF
jgi:hypothetical protein